MQIDRKCHVLWVEMYCSQSLKQSSSETFILTALAGCSCAPSSINLENSAFVFRIFFYSFHYFEPSRRNGRTFYFIPLLGAASCVDTTSPSEITTKRMLWYSFRAARPYESSKTDKKTLVWISSSKNSFLNSENSHSGSPVLLLCWFEILHDKTSYENVTPTSWNLFT